jgi:hypothetical protein
MHRLLSVLVLAGLVSLAGCVTYEEHVQIRKDGSGILSMHMAMDRQVIERMQAMAQQFGQDDSDPLEDIRSDMDKEKIEKNLAESGSKLELTEYDQQVTDDAYVWDLTIAFPHYSDLKDLHMGDEDAAESDSDAPGQFTYEKQVDGTWLYRRGMDEEEGDLMGSEGAMEDGDSEAESDEDAAWMEEKEDDAAGDSESMAEEEAESAEAGEAETDTTADGMEEFGKAMEQMGQMMQAMTEAAAKSSLTFRVTFPGKILESNATRVEGSTAIWEYKLSDLEGAGEEPVMTARIKP